jgi:hypothetical protein
MRKGQLALEGKISNLLARSGYTINASGVSDSALNDIRRAGAAIQPAPQGVSIQSPTRDHANLVVDKIRAAGGLIDELKHSGSSLEDLFLKATASDETLAERAA